MRAALLPLLLLLSTSAASGCWRDTIDPVRGCRFDTDCAAGQICSSGSCAQPTDPRPLEQQSGDPGSSSDDACVGSSSCAAGETCVAGRCVQGCGDVTALGVCDGRTLLYCASEGEPNEGIVAVDCALYVPTTSNAQCTVIDAESGMVGCAVLAREVCMSPDEGVVTSCPGREPGCVEDAETGVGRCEEDVGRCDPALAVQCVGDVLVEGCWDDHQPIGPRCGDLGAACSAGACRGVPEGGACDEERFLCGAGLVCVGEGPGKLGVCEAGCGDITFGGRCDGDTLRYCANEGQPDESVVVETCAGEAPVCGEVEPGVYYCVAAIGQQCVFADGAGGYRGYFCDGPGSGCLVDPATRLGACRGAVGACVEPAADQSYAPTCFGAVLAYQCEESQAFGYDCASLGGACDASAGVCAGLPVGAACGDSLLRCATGLSCTADPDGVQRCR